MGMQHHPCTLPLCSVLAASSIQPVVEVAPQVSVSEAGKTASNSSEPTESSAGLNTAGDDQGMKGKKGEKGEGAMGEEEGKDREGEGDDAHDDIEAYGREKGTQWWTVITARGAELAVQVGTVQAGAGSSVMQSSGALIF